MDKIKDTRSFMRITHRYLGYFLAGIMAVYALSGVLLVYRDTDFLKKERNTIKLLRSTFQKRNWEKN
ncbi:PepSY domain-containing protein [Chryseobacterium carnipullorum]|uniref:PepSY domain-containing protein n=1 Tax=Chryseobacterium carnipullorum TaxID=1124835 RepID=UPI001E4C64CA|nr:PepSY domain-containing protein [Chryseobacterium carnipullorum]